MHAAKPTAPFWLQDVPTNTHFLSSFVLPTCAKCEPSVSLMASFVCFGNLNLVSIVP